MPDDVYRVITTDGRNRKVFEGSERAAQRYVQEHFPRIHVEPGVDTPPTPDVLIHAPNNGGVRGYHGFDDDEHQWFPYEKDDQGWYPVHDEDNDEDSEPVPPVKSTPSKATATKTTGK